MGGLEGPPKPPGAARDAPAEPWRPSGRDSVIIRPMDEVGRRLPYLLNVLVPLLLFMACVYLALHILFARLVARPDSPVLWFFGVVTGPLTRPVRALLPRGTPEPRVRAVALGLYVVLWLTVRVLFVGIGLADSG